MKPTDLRGILHYIPQFRDQVFILAMDGAVVADDNFPNLLMDVAVLRSLSIRLVLVHGAGYQVQKLAQELSVPITNWDGTGITDGATLRVAIMAANSVTHEILEGLSLNNLRGALTNCIEAVPLGILKGVDHQYTGKVHQVDVELLRTLLDRGIIPVIPPVACDGSGNTYRLNSDSVAVEVARQLGAVKLMYIGTAPGIELDGKLVPQMSVKELESVLKQAFEKIPAGVQSKAVHALQALQGGVERVHILSGTVDEGLLAEVFSNEGIGTLIYANQYQGIRPAQRKDLRHIFALIKPAMEGEQLIKRNRRTLEKELNEFFVFEIDGNIVGCCQLHPTPELKKAELACLHVSPPHANRGIGTKLAQYAETLARERGCEQIFCLSTQAFTFFQHKLGYREGTIDDLPPGRREKYEQNGRRSKILVKSLALPAAPTVSSAPAPSLAGVNGK
ncbi:MAG: amino-acid N-acetyltransferase [Verrucomicrobiae bacterium]|nr:amino-acid N-acetyltransferase [Verrucomicrobiae bacterium]